MDIIFKEWAEDEELGNPSLYIETGLHFLKDSILEVVGEDERLGRPLSYIVIMSHYVLAHPL